MSIGDGITMGMGLSSLIWAAAWILSIHLKGQQGYWYPDHLGPKTVKNDDGTPGDPASS